MKPLDVKTKFYNAESEDVFLGNLIVIISFIGSEYNFFILFLEAQVQNVTAGPLCLEKVGMFLKDA